MTNPQHEALMNLLPCPFCGCDAEMQAYDYHGEMWTASCEDGCCMGSMNGEGSLFAFKADAAAAWNTRDSIELAKNDAAVERVARAICIACDSYDPDYKSGGLHPLGQGLDDGEAWWTGYREAAIAALSATAATPSDEVVRLRAELRRIAEGNLGDAAWQANYDRIREVARAALEPQAKDL